LAPREPWPTPPGLIDEARTSLAEAIREEGERLDRFVQNLFDMTRLGHGALKIRLVAVDLSDLVGAARGRLKGPLRDRLVEVAIPPDLPPALANPILTEQVPVNVLDNAAKYALPGTPVRVAARAQGGAAVLEVSDEGPGIPEAERERVFDMFHRVEAGDRDQAGTGLGLAICRGLLEAQGGTIRIEGAPGGGARVVVALPLAQGAMAVGQAA
jgi:two-component system sensor histidine kinase KdpD